MRRFRAFRAVGVVLGTVVLTGLGAACLPDAPYERFQLLDNTIQRDARWIYERTTFDTAPIDVAFLGPSRIGAAVDAPLLQKDLAALGVQANVVNLSTPEEGRNLNLVFAEELFASKHPKLVVIGVIEKPGRFGHPAYKYLAPAAMVANPGYVGNLSYASDLMYLPFRQMKLFAARLFPSLSGFDEMFDPSRYAGSNPPFANVLHLPDGRTIDRTTVVPAESLENAQAKRAVAEHPPILPRALADVEFGGDRHYIRAIAELAKQHGARMAFLFLPYFHGPRNIQEQALYTSFGPVIDAGFLADHAPWFSDVAHLNRDGATALTDWLAPYIKQELEGTTPAS